MTDDRAPQRFYLLQLARLGGVVLVVIGLIATQGRLGLPEAAGYVLLLAGIAEFFVVPRLLARKWRSPDA
jgi:hypothetical protein